MTKQDKEKVATELRTSFKERADHTLHIPVTLPAKVTKIENDCIYLDLFNMGIRGYLPKSLSEPLNIEHVYQEGEKVETEVVGYSDAFGRTRILLRTHDCRPIDRGAFTRQKLGELARTYSEEAYMCAILAKPIEKKSGTVRTPRSGNELQPVKKETGRKVLINRSKAHIILDHRAEKHQVVPDPKQIRKTEKEPIRSSKVQKQQFKPKPQAASLTSPKPFKNIEIELNDAKEVAAYIKKLITERMNGSRKIPIIVPARSVLSSLHRCLLNLCGLGIEGYLPQNLIHSVLACPFTGEELAVEIVGYIDETGNMRKYIGLNVSTTQLLPKLCSYAKNIGEEVFLCRTVSNQTIINIDYEGKKQIAEEMKLITQLR